MHTTADMLKKELARAKINAQAFAVSMVSIGVVAAIAGRGNSPDLRAVGTWLVVAMWLGLIGVSLWERRRYVRLIRDLEAPASSLP